LIFYYTSPSEAAAAAGKPRESERGYVTQTSANGAEKRSIKEVPILTFKYRETELS
jgi:hypothetical protein